MLKHIICGVILVSVIALGWTHRLIGPLPRNILMPEWPE